MPEGTLRAHGPQVFWDASPFLINRVPPPKDKNEWVEFANVEAPVPGSQVGAVVARCRQTGAQREKRILRLRRQAVSALLHHHCS
jgi:hypothetical protein